MRKEGFSEFSNKATGAGLKTRLQMVLLLSLWDHFPELKPIFDTFVFSLELFVVVEVRDADWLAGVSTDLEGI